MIIEQMEKTTTIYLRSKIQDQESRNFFLFAETVHKYQGFVSANEIHMFLTKMQAVGAPHLVFNK